MQPLDRVIRTRRALAATIAARAVLGGVATVLLTAAVLTAALRRSGVTTSSVVWLVAGLAGATALALLVRAWSRLTVPGVALWIEERVPALQYALVTAVDPAGAGPGAPFLEREIERVVWDREAGRAMVRGLGWPVLAALGGLTAFLMSLRVGVGVAVERDRATPSVTATAARDVPAPFARLVATVRSPAYAGGQEVRVESPASIAALVGSTVVLEAPGSSDGVTAYVGDRSITVQHVGTTWRTTVTVESRPTVVRLRHASAERLVALEVLAVGGHVVADLAPGDGLVEELLGRRAHPPPPLARAGGPAGEPLRAPALAGGHGGKHLVGRDVAEVEVGGESARRLAVRLVPVLGVSRKPLLDERGQTLARSFGSAGDTVHRTDAMVDGKPFERVGGGPP